MAIVRPIHHLDGPCPHKILPIQCPQMAILGVGVVSGCHRDRILKRGYSNTKSQPNLP